MVRKPGRRKTREVPTGKIIAVAVAALLIGATGWYIYTTYIYKAPPVYARINTSLGSFDIELFTASAPKTVANFVNLTNSGFYNDLVWHRIIAGQLIQTGDPNTRGGINSTRGTWGTGGSSVSVPFEYDPSLHNDVGYIGMASTAAKVGGTSQFYINVGNNTNGFDGNYAVFGKVLNASGMSVVDAIANVPVYHIQTCPPGFSTNPNASCLDQPIVPVFVTSIVILTGP